MIFEFIINIVILYLSNKGNIMPVTFKQAIEAQSDPESTKITADHICSEIDTRLMDNNGHSYCVQPESTNRTWRFIFCGLLSKDVQVEINNRYTSGWGDILIMNLSFLDPSKDSVLVCLYENKLEYRHLEIAAIQREFYS
jgi:hypothetical protein